MRSEPVVQVQALVKRYGTKTAVDGLDLAARQGVTAVLGPNGAGKTSTVEICEGTGGRTPARCASWVSTRSVSRRRCGPASA